MSQAIPTPPSIPFIGHAASIDKEVPLYSLNLLAKQYGDIYQLNMLGQKTVVINNQELLHEVSDESRFRKTMSSGLFQVRNAVGDGLFTADVPKEKNWYIAHRILMPAFSTLNVRNMFDDMVDVVQQLVTKWERFGPHHRLEPSQDFTALTLEAICLCAMSYRMNAFYVQGLHPFAKSMADFLYESGLRAKRPTIVTNIMRSSSAKYEEDRNVLMSYVDNILQDRKEHPTDKKDILHLMLTGKDKETGLGLSDENIKNNLLTFLIAGHETTSGMLTFILYFLLRNPEAMRKLREEVDTSIGQRPMTIDDVHKLPYMLAVMREALRLAPPAPLRSVSPLKDTTMSGGRYAVEGETTSIWCNIFAIQRDPKVWGEDADSFRPERMMDGKFEALPPDSWQPFGYGMRGCIGRPFAWQEVQIALVMLMQRFDFVMHDPAYDLKYKQTLSIKPTEFYIHAIPRTDKARIVATPSSTLLHPSTAEKPNVPTVTTQQDQNKKPIYLLYGSNTGTSESFAQRIASDASAHGFNASIGTLDSAVDHIPTDGPVVIVTASFEGQPADNAAHFVEWLTSLSGNELSNVSFAVFGCGNRDWAQTYQKIPILCDQLIADRGGKRLVARGEGDAGSADFFDAFELWSSTLWKTLAAHYGTTLGAEANAVIGIEIKALDTGTTRATVLRQPDAALGSCVENRILTAQGAPVKRHIEFELPEGMTFRAGDYLAILPINPSQNVSRAMARFGLSGEQEITISAGGPTPLPTGRPITVSSILSGYVELSQPATTRDLRLLTAMTQSEPTLQALNALSASYAEQVIAKRLSVLDILEDHKDIHITFAAFLQMLPSMRVRQYSISSSPLANAQRASLTVSVLEATPISGRKEPFLGVASTYLAGLRPGDKVQLAVRPSNVAFHPPADLSVPLVMLCAGSGLAPMRGFLQERAAQKEAGREVAKSVLFFGCRSPQQDYLYSDSDLKAWSDLGIVDIHPAFSKDPAASHGAKYIQDRLWQDREEVISTWHSGAQLYVCGAGRMATAVKETLIKIIQESLNVDAAAATEKFPNIVNGRFATDVFE